MGDQSEPSQRGRGQPPIFFFRRSRDPNIWCERVFLTASRATADHARVQPIPPCNARPVCIFQDSGDAAGRRTGSAAPSPRRWRLHNPPAIRVTPHRPYLLALHCPGSNAFGNPRQSQQNPYRQSSAQLELIEHALPLGVVLLPARVPSSDGPIGLLLPRCVSIHSASRRRIVNVNTNRFTLERQGATGIHTIANKGAVRFFLTQRALVGQRAGNRIHPPIDG